MIEVFNTGNPYGSVTAVYRHDDDHSISAK